jgi:hypothetical protein
MGISNARYHTFEPIYASGEKNPIGEYSIPKNVAGARNGNANDNSIKSAVTP